MTADRARTRRLPPRWFVRTAWVLHRALDALPARRATETAVVVLAPPSAAPAGGGTEQAP